MPTFIYEAMSATGKPSKGTMEASSSEEVIQKLRGEGMFPTQVKPQKEATKAAKASTRAPWRWPRRWCASATRAWSSRSPSC